MAEQAEQTLTHRMGPVASVDNDELAAIVADGLCHCKRKSQIRAELEILLEQAIPYRTFERLMHRARKMNEMRSGRTRQEMRDDSINFYERIIADPNTSIQHKLYARMRLDNVQGIEPQFNSGAEQSAEDQARAAREFVAAAKQRSGLLSPEGTEGAIKAAG